MHIPGSPYKIVVGSVHGNDPSTVEVFGKGVQYGTTGRRSSFVIDTSSVGAGTLSITVDGPSKVPFSAYLLYFPNVFGKDFIEMQKSNIFFSIN